MSLAPAFGRIASDLPRLLAVLEDLPIEYRNDAFRIAFTALVEDAIRTEPSASVHGLATSVATDEVILSDTSILALRRAQLQIDDILKIGMIANERFVIFKKPTTPIKADAQLEWALLTSLTNLMNDGELAVSREEIRTACIEAGVYDKSNFSENLKKRPEYFAGRFEPRNLRMRLTPLGEGALRDLIGLLS